MAVDCPKLNQFSFGLLGSVLVCDNLNVSGTCFFFSSICYTRGQTKEEIAMPQTITKNATKTELYKRFCNLSERDASRVLGYIDALEDE